MGRPENPIDPQDGPVQRFAFELRKLRDEAGAPAYRAMARRAGYSAATLSQAAAGERLPTLPVLLAYVGACHGEAEEWRRRWQEANEELTRRPRPQEDDSDPPYKGLARFEPGDAELFFGREELTSQLAETARRHRVSALVGASGSGKSSLLRAGLVPHLRQPEADAAEQAPAAIRILTPGTHPAAHRERLEPAHGPGETWLLVDQFEELFTLCTDDEERNAFIECLLAARDNDSRLRVILAVRADFFGHCATHRELAAALKNATLLAGPMDTDQLRAAIVRPAAAHGLIVERDLTARIIKDVADEPGALPLMSHALRETWRRRSGRTLTTQVYEAAGGLRGAIARTAEDTYHRLSPAQATLARHILLRLIAPGNGTQDTHRPTAQSEFTAPDPHGTQTQTGTADVLDHLARSRLITLDDGYVSLAHEALITAWPRLHAWINEERDRMRLHRQLTHNATVWQELARDPAALYRGTPLTRAEEAFAGQQRGTLNSLEAAFLDAGLAAREAEHRQAARAVRRSRCALAAFAALCALALVAGTIAWQQTRDGDQQHAQAEARRIATVAAGLRTTDPVRALRLSVAAWKLAHTPETHGALLAAALSQRERDAMPQPLDVDPLNVTLSGDGRTLLSLVKDRIRRWDIRTRHELAPLRVSTSHGPERFLQDVTDDGRAALVRHGEPARVYSITGGRTTVQGVPAATGEAKFSGDGRTLLMEKEGDVQLWDRRHQRLLFQHPLGDDGPYALGLDTGGRRVAACSQAGSLAAWEITGKVEEAKVLPVAAARKKGPCTADPLFTPDGRGLLTEGPRGAEVRDVMSGRTRWRVEHSGLEQVRLSGDGAFLVGRDADEILLWRTSRPQAPVLRYPIPNEEVSALRIDTAHRVIRYLGGDTVRSISFPPSPAWREIAADAAQFGPGGRKLLTSHTAGDRTRFHVLDGDSGTQVAELPSVPCLPTKELKPHSCARASSELAFGPDGRRLAYSASSTSRLHLWDLRAHGPVPVPRAAQRTDGGALFSADGESLFAADSDRESLRIWDTRRNSTRTLRSISGTPMAVHPGGRSLVVVSGGEKETGRLVDLRTQRIGRQVLTGESITAVAFRPDGGVLAAGDARGRVTLWDGRAQRRLGQLSTTDGPSPGRGPEGINALAFSPDGKTLATAGDKGTVRLWDAASNLPLGDPLPTTPGDPVLALAFTPDGTTLRIAGRHTPVQSFATATDSAARTLCQRAHGGLTPNEWHSYLPTLPYRATC
ncbi:hypothetical protein ACFVJH_37025 [Streptomyces decoyicus]|uniref:nSTAND1 domain-containing NTPase n=1 Tax=Streptomyces decoyicus TaxID=249567 RepID=UPI003630C9F4